jgi:hypothetical protein
MHRRLPFGSRHEVDTKLKSSSTGSLSGIEADEDRALAILEQTHEQEGIMTFT